MSPFIEARLDLAHMLEKLGAMPYQVTAVIQHVTEIAATGIASSEGDAHFVCLRVAGIRLDDYWTPRICELMNAMVREAIIAEPVVLEEARDKLGRRMQLIFNPTGIYPAGSGCRWQEGDRWLCATLIDGCIHGSEMPKETAQSMFDLRKAKTE